MLTKKTTNSMGTYNYKNNSPSHQDETKIVTKMYLEGRGIVEIANVRKLRKTQCFVYIKEGLEDYQREKSSGKHLSFADRRFVEFEKLVGKSNKRIAKVLGCHPSTVTNELKRKTGNFYNAKSAQKDYNKKNAGWQKPLKLEQSRDFLEEFAKALDKRKESPYSFCQAVLHGDIACLSGRSAWVTPPTLYNWIYRDLVDNVTRDDLPYHNRNRKEEREESAKRDGKHTSGLSIDYRPEIPVDEDGNTTEFGHWEIDTLLGVKDKDEPCLLVLVERKTRYTIVSRIDSKTAACVNKKVAQIKEFFGPKWPEIFKTLTTDNGSEFLKLHKVKGLGKRTYYCHPGCPKEKPYVERTNAMIRVYIPKGTKISNHTAEDVDFVGDCLNSKYRAVLNGTNADALFMAEMNQVYAA